MFYDFYIFIFKIYVRFRHINRFVKYFFSFWRVEIFYIVYLVSPYEQSGINI